MTNYDAISDNEFVETDQTAKSGSKIGTKRAKKGQRKDISESLHSV